MTADLVRLARRLEDQPFCLIAAHSQREEQAEVVAYIRSQGLPPTTPNFTITNFGSHPQVPGTGYVPYYMAFDHHGNLVRHHVAGNHHGGDGLEMIKWVDRLLKETPALYLGEKPFEAVPDLAAAVAAKSKLAEVLRDIDRRFAAGPDAATRAELGRLLEAVGVYRDAELARADRELANAPNRVRPRLRALALDLEGSRLADAVAGRIESLEVSGRLKTAIRVDAALAKIAHGLEKRKACKDCRLRGFRRVRIDCGSCRGANAKAFEKAGKKLRALVEAHPDSPVTERVKRYLATFPPEGE